ncbi:MAG: response regulator transcription factor [Bacteroidota bacterium]
MSEIRVLIVEDEVPIANDIASILEGIDYQVSGIAYNSEKALYELKYNCPDVVLLDINLDDEKDGIDIAHIIKSKYEIPFIYLTSYGDKNTINRAKVTRPMGYIMKPFDETDLFSTLEIALFNFSQMHYPHNFDMEKLNSKLLSKLTQKEFEILCDIYDGNTNRQIAEKHFISPNTVKTHIKHLYDKLDVETRVEAITWLRNTMS